MIVLTGLMIAPRRSSSQESTELAKAYYEWSKLETEKLKEIERQKIALETKKKDLLERAQALKGKWGGQCVIFARLFAGSWVQGYAGNIKPNAKEPQIGGLFKTKGHVGVVLDDLDGRILGVDSNHDFRGTIEIREIPKSDILGYINQ